MPRRKGSAVPGSSASRLSKAALTLPAELHATARAFGVSADDRLWEFAERIGIVSGKEASR